MNGIHDKKELIDYLVDTCEFNPVNSERMKHYLCERTDELSIHDTYEVLNYVERAIERVTSPFGKKLLYMEDAWKQTGNVAFPPSEDHDNRLYAKLFDFEGSDDDFFRSIMEDPDSFQISDETRSRIEILRNELGILPKKPIISIRFDPFSIIYGRRKFDGDSLSYYRKHHNNYEGMNRRHLQMNDSGLYFSLLHSGQLDAAIPEKLGVTYRGFSNPLAYFMSQPELWSMGRRMLLGADSGLYKSLKNRNQLDLAIPKKLNDGIIISDVFVHETGEALRRNRGNMSRTAREIDVPRSSLKMFCSGMDILGFRIFSKETRLSDDQISAILVAHFTHEGNLSEAAKALPNSRKTIREYWKRAGFEISS